MPKDVQSYDLYPELECYWSGFIEVSGGHRLFVETSGNPNGRPVVFLHGGPGAGCSSKQRRFFDPDRYRIILFDQRGAGRSQPLASIDNNETGDLIADIETIRKYLGVKRWLVFGGSWGSTLALAYAARHPACLSGLVLRGVWLGRTTDVTWLMHGLRRLFPEHWEAFAGGVHPDERDDLLAAYWLRLIDPNPEVHLAAAVSWRLWERRCEALLPGKDIMPTADGRTLAVSRIEAHYMRNQVFLPFGSLIAGVKHFRDVPGVIVHGRYDMLATVDAAFALSTVGPKATLDIIADAGHSAFEPGIRARLIAATDNFAGLPAWR